MKQQHQRSNWPTTSRHDRGYGSEWERTRKRILERDHNVCQCVHCKADERVRVATHVDHIVSRDKAKSLGWPTARTESDDNLQALNEECHNRKTQEERGRTYTPPQKIGLDGFPVVRER